MSIRDSAWPAGTPCWVDISVGDIDASGEFYSTVLGWEISPSQNPDFGGYAVAGVDGHAVAGIGPKMSPEQPEQWLLYFATDDIDATAEAVTANGGTLMFPPGEVPGFGKYLVAFDPSGAVFAAWQGTGHLGAELVNEPGGITWEDLRSTDPAAAQTFYSAVFGLELASIDGAPDDYKAFHQPGSPDWPMGGIGGFMGGPEAPSHWAVYFSVADAAAAVAAAEAAGGRTVMPVMDTPYGRMAGLLDPAGAFFQITEAPPS